MPCKSKKSRFLTSLNSNNIYVRSNESDPLCKNTSGICGEPGSQSHPVLYDEVEDIIKTLTPSTSPIVLNFIGSGTFGTEGKIYTYISSIVFNGISQETTSIHGEHVFTLENNITGLKSIPQQQVTIEALSVKYENRWTIYHPLPIVPPFPSMKFEAHDTRFNNGLFINASSGTLDLKLIDSYIEATAGGQVLNGAAAGESIVNFQFNNTNFSSNAGCSNDALIAVSVSGAATLRWNVDGGGFSFGTCDGKPVIAVNVSENGTFIENIKNQTNNVTVEPQLDALTDTSGSAVEIWTVTGNGIIESVKSNIYSQLYSGVAEYCWLQVNGVDGADAGVRANWSNSLLNGCHNFYYGATSFSGIELNGSFTQTGGNFRGNGVVLNGNVFFKDAGYSVSDSRINGSVYQSGGIGSINGSACAFAPTIGKLSAKAAVQAAVVTVDNAGTVVLSGTNIVYGGCGPASIYLQNGGSATISGADLMINAGVCDPPPIYIGGDGSDGTSVSISACRLTGSEAKYAIQDVITVTFSACNYISNSNAIKGAKSVSEVNSGFVVVI